MASPLENQQAEVPHTPTPWATNERASGVFGITADGMTIADVWDFPEAKGNAHLIVNACNAHDDLLEACRAFVQTTDPDGARRFADDNDALPTALRNARAAIAKAEGR